MLWSLAIAAGLGIFAIAFAQSAWTWQIVWSGIMTAITCAVLIPTSALAERPKFQTAGTIAMVVLLLEYLGSLLLIWDIGPRFGNYRIDESIGFSMFILLPASLATIGLLAAAKTRFGRSTAWLGIGLIIATVVIYEIAIVSRLPYPRRYNYWGSGNTTFCLLGLAILCYAGEAHSPRRRWRYFGIIAAVPAWAYALFEIWVPTERPSAGTLSAFLIALAVVIALANLTAFCQLKPQQKWVQKLSIATTAVTALTVALIESARIQGWPAFDSDAYGRLAAATGIAASFATIALCVLWRMNVRSERITESEAARESVGQIELICPRCKIKQSLNPGKSQCAHCELKFEINFEEPRCTKCEYLLVGLTGETCPECGHMIAAIS